MFLELENHIDSTSMVKQHQSDGLYKTDTLTTQQGHVRNVAWAELLSAAQVQKDEPDSMLGPSLKYR